MGIRLKPDNEARFLTWESPIHVLRSETWSGFQSTSCPPREPITRAALLFSYLSSPGLRNAETKMIFNLMPLHKRKIGLVIGT